MVFWVVTVQSNRVCLLLLGRKDCTCLLASCVSFPLSLNDFVFSECVCQ